MTEPNIGFRFCRQCGQEITEDYGFCPACGCMYERAAAPSNGSANVRTEDTAQNKVSEGDIQRMRESYQQFTQDYRHRIQEGNRSMAIAMLGIWVAMSFIFGIMSFVLPETMKNVGDLGKEMVIEGCIFFISCAFAAISAYLCSVRKKQKVAYYSCLVSAFVTLGLFYTGTTTCLYFVLCGLLTALRVRNLRGLF